MNRAVTFAAGFVTALAVAFASLLAVAAATATPAPRTSAISKTEFPYVDWTITELSEKFGVGVSRFADSPCGDTDHILGCWSPQYPNIVWISDTITAPDLERWVTLHEIGHVLHARLGITGSECAADMFARSMLGEVPTAADWNC